MKIKEHLLLNSVYKFFLLNDTIILTFDLEKQQASSSLRGYQMNQAVKG
jgi:hypothetical protein